MSNAIESCAPEVDDIDRHSYFILLTEAFEGVTVRLPLIIVPHQDTALSYSRLTGPVAADLRSRLTALWQIYSNHFSLTPYTHCLLLLIRLFNIDLQTIEEQEFWCSRQY